MLKIKWFDKLSQEHTIEIQNDFTLELGNHNTINIEELSEDEIRITNTTAETLFGKDETPLGFRIYPQSYSEIDIVPEG